MTLQDPWLCLDLGNSRLKAQLRDRGQGGAVLSLDNGECGSWPRRLESLVSAAAGRVALCSVRASLAEALVEALAATGARITSIHGDSEVPFPVAVQSRETLGADRLCNVAAAWAESIAPALVIDAGTAVTADLVDADGCHRGGAILPGAAITLDALARGGEALFQVSPDWPDTPWGEDSAAALAAGALWGGLAALEGLAARFRADWGEAGTVLLTGGTAPAFAARWSAGALRVEADWTLRGIAALAFHAAS